jgi:hypothetical protein
MLPTSKQVLNFTNEFLEKMKGWYNQRIISYCLWGDKPIYNVGAVRNAEIFKKFYPDFKCRFYIHRPTVPQETIDKLVII